MGGQGVGLSKNRQAIDSKGFLNRHTSVWPLQIIAAQPRLQLAQGLLVGPGQT